MTHTTTTRPDADAAVLADAAAEIALATHTIATEGGRPEADVSSETTPAPTTVTLTEAQARQVTEQIRRAAVVADKALSKLYGLIADAKHGQAWKVLGFKSWPAYLADTMGSNGALPLAREDLTKLVRKLAGEGMSARAIESATGGAVSKATANRIAQRAGITVATVTTDGKTRSKPAKSEASDESGESATAPKATAPKLPAPKHDPKNPAVQAVRAAIATKGKGKSPEDRVRLSIAEYDAAIAALLAARASVVRAGQKS